MRRNPKMERELWLCIRHLAWRKETIKTRIVVAYEYHLSYVVPESMPREDLRLKLEEIKNKLTKNHTVSVEEAIRRMHLKTLSTLVQDLCDIYDSYIHFEWDRQ